MLADVLQSRGIRLVTKSRPVFTNVSAPTQDDLLGMSLDENSASSEPTDLRSALT